jgi:hypothetical protein
MIYFFTASFSLAIVCEQYETNIMTAQQDSNINIMSSIFFCHIKIDKKSKGKDKGGANLEDDSDEQLDMHKLLPDGSTYVGLGLSKTLHDNKSQKGTSQAAEMLVYDKLEIDLSNLQMLDKVFEWSLKCSDQIRREIIERDRFRTMIFNGIKKMVISKLRSKNGAKKITLGGKEGQMLAEQAEAQ